jgi:DNA helicase-2/ATP-dependent DNA helicase PcrA
MTTPNAAVASDEQRAAITYVEGNAYVGAGPGTGKTYLLVERYRFLRARGVAGAKMLVLTFSRRAVVELRERLMNAGFAASDVEVRTFHGFAARAIGGGTATFRTGRLLDGFSRQMLLESVIAKTSMSTLGAAARSSRAFSAEAGALLEDLGRVPESSLAGLEREASPRLRDLIALARAAAAARASIGGSDIGDLVSRAVAATRIPESTAARWLENRYTHVLVDEFQDTDRMQLELLTALHAEIFAVGDEAQSIYRFRGARNDIVAEAIGRFEMRRFDLTLSRRCTPEICALAARTPISGLLPLHSARASGAPVEVLRVRAVDDEVVLLADAIEAAADANVHPSSIAVLLRSFRPLGPLLIDELRRRAIPVASTGREALLGDVRVRTLRAALEVLDSPADIARWSNLLASRPLGFDPIAVRFAASSWPSVAIGEGLSAKLAEVRGDATLESQTLASALAFAEEAWRAGDLGLAARRLVRRLGLLANVMAAEAPGEVRSAAARLKLVCDALAGAQRTAMALGIPNSPHDLVARFDDFLAALGLDDAGLDPDASGVRILTVHAAKGLEFSHVFIADAVTGHFPAEARASALVSPADRAILARHGVDGAATAADAAALEEASLWYVAVTRSRERLTISYADQGLNGDVQRPSRFIPLELVAGEITSVNRESLYVRALRHGDAATHERVLASGALADAPALEEYARLGPAAFASDAGQTFSADVRLGVGDAELWLQCPRRLYYKKFVGLPQEESAALELGKSIHAVLEAFHERHAAFDASSIDVASWNSDLRQLRRTLWNDDAYASPVVARAAAAAADVALDSYASALGERARTVSFEVETRERKVSISLGRFSLSGRVDRIDTLADGTRVVIDYKRGHAKKISVAKAAKKIRADWMKNDADGLPRQPLARRAPGELKLQLAFYATAFEAVSAVAYVFLGGVEAPWRRNGAAFEVEPFAGDLRDVANAALHEIQTALLAPLSEGSMRHFPVTLDEDACTFCPYRSVCPGVDGAA